MKSRLPLVVCCLLTTLLVGVWLGQKIPSGADEAVERSTVSPFNSDGWQLARGQQSGPAATLATERPFGRAPLSDPAVHQAAGEDRQAEKHHDEPDIAYFPEVIVETAGETAADSSDAPSPLPADESPKGAATLSKTDDAVWKAELSDLPPEQAEEILRLRQQLGSVASESLGLSFPEIPDTVTEPPGLFPLLAEGEARPIPAVGPILADAHIAHAAAAVEEAPLAKKLRREAERNYAENIANAETPGYKRRQIVLLNVSVTEPIEATNEPGKAVHAGSETSDAALKAVSHAENDFTPWLSRLDLQQGELTPTSNPLDIAIGGHGWFKVERNGSEEFVRTGMLGFDGEGQLGIHTAAGLLPIIPKLQLPSDQQRIIIAETGEVYAEKTLAAENATGVPPFVTKLVLFDFRNASALKRTPVGTYAATNESGEALTAYPNSARFLQAVLEASNVDREKEIADAGHLRETAERFAKSERSIALP
jgi:flagellar basal body rod protein FlgG